MSGKHRLSKIEGIFLILYFFLFGVLVFLVPVFQLLSFLLSKKSIGKRLHPAATDF